MQTDKTAIMHAACRAIARNPKAVVQQLTDEQIQHLASLQNQFEERRADFEYAKHETEKAVSAAFFNIRATK